MAVLTGVTFTVSPVAVRVVVVRVVDVRVVVGVGLLSGLLLLVRLGLLFPLLGCLQPSFFLLCFLS